MSVLFSWLLFLGLIGVSVLFGLAVWISMGKVAKRADEEIDAELGGRNIFDDAVWSEWSEDDEATP